ncbi:AraC family transcriptional regulator [Paenibacillus lautus]|uniref:AraC family transcriptional regulator n=1 Tax=Paenibacillus lautus TaxID=1401 RepID=UPI001C7DAE87|nr:AraC family transcriptional regulator [Paenibacillus lautus]MBX4149104.1 AraC family transcriptional regulator [Paenibacillus lautus]
MWIKDQVMLWTSASFQISDIRRRRLQPEDWLEYRAPAELFLVSLAGKARIKTEGIDLGSVDAPIVHVGKGAKFRIAEATDDYEYLLILYKALLPAPLPRSLDQPQLAVRQFHSCYAIPVAMSAPYRKLASEMEQMWGQEHPLSRLEAKRHFYAFVHQLLTEMEQREADGAVIDEDPVEVALRHMEAHYGEPWTLASLAERLGTNTRRLQRGFNARFGHSPLEHLIEIRLKRAKKLLKKSELPISNISEEVGYPDSYYFSRLFKKYVGMSPSDYRMKCKNEQRMTDMDCRISPALPSHTIIVPTDQGRYDQRGGVLEDFRTLMALTLMCTGGIAHIDRKVRVPHLRGTLELERIPERIAVLDYQYVDQLLALGVHPIGSVVCNVEVLGLPSDLARTLHRMAHLGSKEIPDLSAISAIEPDMIICTGFQEHRYEELSAIAPTILLDRNEDWRQSLLRLGALLDCQVRALSVLDAYGAKLNAIRNRLKAAGEAQSVALIRPRDGKIRLHSGRHRTARLLYDDLGLAAPPLPEMSQGTSSMIPLEALPELKADRLFVLTDNTNREQTRMCLQSEAWNSTSAVLSDKVRHFHTALWIGYYGPLGMNRVVDEIAATLLPN